MPRTRAHWLLADLDDGFDNRNENLDQRQNQNNDMSFAHLLSSPRAWTKGRPNWKCITISKSK
jgi:hypothetical protein